MLSLPKWLGVKSKELLGSLIVIEFYKDGAFEKFVSRTTKANSVSRAIRRKEGLDIKLRAWLLVSKALSVDAARLCLGSRDRGVISYLPVNLFLAFCSGNLKERACSEGINNNREILEAFHATERADLLDCDWKISRTVGHIPQEIIRWEVGVAEVKFDL
jgi:hypothetical protein